MNYTNVAEKGVVLDWGFNQNAFNVLYIIIIKQL